MSSPDENKAATPKAARDEAYVEYCKKITSLPTETVLEDIRQCKEHATGAVANMTLPEQRAYQNRLVEGGLISIVLSLLKRCERETLADVIGEKEDGEKYISSPGVWLVLLANTVSPEDASAFGGNSPHCLEIAESIEPLIKCMRDDQARELFKSKEHWAAAYPFSAALLMNTVMANPHALDVLLQYEGFSEMVIQILFWEEHRPDIMGDEHCQKFIHQRLPMVTHSAWRILYLLFAKTMKGVGPGLNEQKARSVNQMTNEEKKQLYKIGITPIVSEAYDPKCAVPFVLGLLELVRSSTAAHDLEAKQIWYFMLGELAASECVDESVIKGVVDLGSHFASDPIDAAQLPKVLYRMLHVSSLGASQPTFDPVDSRYAVAIDAGLFQMCFKMLIRFGSARNGQICDLLGPMLQSATAVAFHPKSSKAIENVQRQVKAEFFNPELQRFNGNAKCQQVLMMLAFFAKEPEPRHNSPTVNEGDGAASCRNCSKALEKDAVKRCSRCKVATYCSRDCQTAHWKGGHKLVCNKRQITTSQPIGRREEDKLHVQADNIMRTSSGIFMHNIPYILQWCAVNGVDILDCVVVSNFCVAPPSFDVHKSSDFLSTNGCAMRPGQRLHQTAKKRFAKNRSEGNVTSITIIKPAAGGELATMMQDFPGSSLRCGSWQAALAKEKELMAREGWREGLPHPIG